MRLITDRTCAVPATLQPPPHYTKQNQILEVPKLRRSWPRNLQLTCSRVVERMVETNSTLSVPAFVWEFVCSEHAGHPRIVGVPNDVPLPKPRRRPRCSSVGERVDFIASKTEGGTITCEEDNDPKNRFASVDHHT